MTAIFFLADFSVIKPDPGLILWTSLIFIFLWFFLGKMAFRPIQQALKKREQDIQSSLDEAKHARQEMANLKAENEKLLAEAREERTRMLKEAKEAGDNIINKAKEKAKEEAVLIMASAKQEIQNQRMALITDLKNQIGLLAIDVAEKVLRKELKQDSEQTKYINTLVDEIKLN
ncbi:MAG: F0F1 ATP synthase subunit B [Saprospiraceae bacterium]|nr:F0F1 ATP synthase subunit B [Saprospiraceae bacterium]